MRRCRAGPESGSEFVTEEQLEVARNGAVHQASSRGMADCFILSSATKLPPDSGPATYMSCLPAQCSAHTCSPGSPASLVSYTNASSFRLTSSGRTRTVASQARTHACERALNDKQALPFLSLGRRCAMRRGEGPRAKRASSLPILPPSGLDGGPRAYGAGQMKCHQKPQVTGTWLTFC